MVKIFSGLLIALAFLCIALMPEFRSNQWAEVWKAIAPNLAAEMIGLGVAVLFAEHYLKRFRTAGGKAKIAPMLMRQLGPVVHVEAKILKAAEYTPAEFKAIHMAYIEGNLDPVHIPKEFIERITKAITSVTPEEFLRAVDAARKANEFAAKFASMLEEEHLVLLEMNHDMFSGFAEAAGNADTPLRELAEAYLDAHDTLNDVAVEFSFPETLRKMKSEI
jgi:hypothetical protein